MLIDGLNLTASGGFRNSGIEHISALPTTNLYDGREVVLTAQEGANAPGPYTYLGTAWIQLVSKSYVDSLLAGLSSTWASLGGKPDTVAGFGITDAYTKTQTDQAIATAVDAVDMTTFVAKSGSSMTGFLALHAAPTEGAHAATKSYVDTALAAAVSNLDYKASVYRASTTNITMVNGNLEYIDGVQIPSYSGGRILLTGQTNPAENGIWYENNGGWARPADFQTGKVSAGAYTFVETGTHAGTGWALSTTGAVNVGSTALTFVQITNSSYTLPTASAATLGGVKIDGTSITINNGVISATPYSLPVASNSVLGGVKVDGTSITINNGVISAAGGGAGGVVPNDLAWSVYSVPNAGEVVMRFRAARAITISSDQANGQARAGVAATASTTFNIAKNGANVGTIVFAASSTIGVITLSSAINLAVGDQVSVTAPASADATLADIDFTLVGVVG